MYQQQYNGLSNLIDAIKQRRQDKKEQRQQDAIANTISGVNSWQPEAAPDSNNQVQGLFKMAPPQPSYRPQGLFGSDLTMSEQQPANFRSGANMGVNIPQFNQAAASVNAPQQQPSYRQMPNIANNVDITTPQPAQPTNVAAPNRNAIMSQFTKQRATTIKELVKNGMPARDALAYVDASLKPRVDELYNDQASQYQSQVIDKFTNMPNMDDKKAYMWAVRAKMSGLPIDPDQFSKMFAAKKLEMLNLGDRFQAVDPTQPGEYQINVSPNSQLSANVAMRGQDISAANNAARIAAGGGRGGSGQKAARPLAQLTDRSKHIFTLLGGDHVMGKEGADGEPTVKEFGARSKEEFVNMVNQYAPELEQLEAAGYDVSGPIQYLSQQWGL